MLKKISIIIGVFLLLSSFNPIASTHCNQKTMLLFKVDSKNINILENNEEKKVETFYPVIIKNGRSMVEAVLFSKYWNFGNGVTFVYVADTKEVIFSFSDNDNNELVITVDTKNKIGRAIYDDKELTMDVIPFQPLNSEKMIAVVNFVLPIRLIFETFGYIVEWNNESREITAYK